MAALETDKMLETSCGSPHYASPEIVAGKVYHGAPSDIWSCGIILFALLTGHLPFDDDNIRRLLLKVQQGRFTMPRDLSHNAKDLISRMLRVDPEERIGMADILTHPLLKKYPVKKKVPQPVPIETVRHPVNSREEIDPEILKNLQTLWHGEDRENVIHRLLSNEENPEKVFYCLLMKFRKDHIEDLKRAEARTSEPDPLNIPSKSVNGQAEISSKHGDSGSGHASSPATITAHRPGHRSVRTPVHHKRISTTSAIHMSPRTSPTHRGHHKNGSRASHGSHGSHASISISVGPRGHSRTGSRSSAITASSSHKRGVTFTHKNKTRSINSIRSTESYSPLEITATSATATTIRTFHNTPAVALPVNVSRGSFRGSLRTTPSIKNSVQMPPDSLLSPPVVANSQASPEIPDDWLDVNRESTDFTNLFDSIGLRETSSTAVRKEGRYSNIGLANGGEFTSNRTVSEPASRAARVHTEFRSISLGSKFDPKYRQVEPEKKDHDLRELNSPTSSKPFILPMIFEEDRFADSVEQEMDRWAHTFTTEKADGKKSTTTMGNMFDSSLEFSKPAEPFILGKQSKETMGTHKREVKADNVFEASTGHVSVSDFSNFSSPEPNDYANLPSSTPSTELFLKDSVQSTQSTARTSALSDPDTRHSLDLPEIPDTPYKSNLLSSPVLRNIDSFGRRNNPYSISRGGPVNPINHSNRIVADRPTSDYGEVTVRPHSGSSEPPPRPYSGYSANRTPSAQTRPKSDPVVLSKYKVARKPLASKDGNSQAPPTSMLLSKQSSTRSSMAPPAIVTRIPPPPPSPMLPLDKRFDRMITSEDYAIARARAEDQAEIADKTAAPESKRSGSRGSSLLRMLSLNPRRTAPKAPAHPVISSPLQSPMIPDNASFGTTINSTHYDTAQSKIFTSSTYETANSGTRDTEVSGATSSFGVHEAPRQNWFMKMLAKDKPETTQTFDSSVNKRILRSLIIQVLIEWQKYGLSNISEDLSTFTVRGMISSRNVLSARSAKFRIEIVDVKYMGYNSSAVFFKEKGSRSSFNRLLKEMRTALVEKGALMA